VLIVRILVGCFTQPQEQSHHDCPANVVFSDLAKLCEHYFGKPRQSGSHLILAPQAIVKLARYLVRSFPRSPWECSPRSSSFANHRGCPPSETRSWSFGNRVPKRSLGTSEPNPVSEYVGIDSPYIC
jgi:hypothetical protein